MAKEKSIVYKNDTDFIKFKKVVELSKEIVFITDKNGIINYINPEFTKTYGIEEDEVVGKLTPQIIQSEVVDSNYYSEVWKALLKNKELKKENITKNKEGIKLNIEETFNLLKDENDQVVGFLTIQRSRTNHKNSEEELRNLENLAAIGRMYSHLSHEIKNPLASIKNYLDLLSEEEEFSEKLKKPLVLVRDEVKRLNNLMRDVLEFSRPINLINVEIDLKSLIEKVRETLSPVLLKKQIELVNNIKEIRLFGDYLRLQSVFLNLVENSIDAIASDGVIEIWSETKKEHCFIFIKDNGHGVEQKEKIFEPFFTTKTYGTGLGLPIIKKILELHNGDVHLVSSQSGETIFKLIFTLDFLYGKNSNN